MKALPVKRGEQGYVACPIEEATHLTINMPGPTGRLTLPVIRHGTRAGTGCWSWNGSVDAPTIKPSILTKMGRDGHIVCHTWVNDGKVQFLGDCTHELRGQTMDLLDVDEPKSKEPRP